MKKSIVIVVVIAVVILGFFVWVGQSKPLDKTLDKTISDLRVAKSVVLEKLKEAILNETTLQIGVSVDGYYQKNNTGVFEKDTDSLTKIDNYLAGLKNNRGIDVEYFVHSTKTNYVVKTKEKGANNFYCLDTTTESVKPVVVEIVNNNFIATTGCNGVELK
ncbi:MAG: hypothetical protein AAB497_02165 [Patescibacteria group bacterium]